MSPLIEKKRRADDEYEKKTNSQKIITLVFLPDGQKRGGEFENYYA